MVESKYAKYFVTEVVPSKAEATDMRNRIVYLDNSVIQGAFYVECLWFWKGSEKAIVKAHTHDFDEVITFFGTNPEDPHDLCGEIELWLGDEKYILTKSFLAFVPKGLSHGPLIVRRVDRPIFHFTAGPSGTYDRDYH